VFCLHQATGLVLLLWQMSAKREFFVWLLVCFSTLLRFRFRLLFRRFLHISPLSQPPFIFFLARIMQGSAAGISISPLCASTIVNSRPRGENRGDWTRSKNHSSFDLFCWRLLVSSVWGLSQAGKYGLSCLWYREISVASKPSHKDLNFSSAGLLVVYHASTRYH